MDATADGNGSTTQAGRDIITNTYVGVRAKYLVGAVVVAALAAGGWALSEVGSPSGGHQDRAGSARHGAVPPSPKPSRSTHSTAPIAAPKKLIDARPFALRAPAQLDSVAVDLDKPKIERGYGSLYDDLRLDDEWRFTETVGFSKGPSYKDCKAGLADNAMPSSLDAETLNARRTVHTGTRLCTETSDGNLAMLEIIKLTPADEDYDLPDVMTRLTVWESAPTGP